MTLSSTVCSDSWVVSSHVLTRFGLFDQLFFAIGILLSLLRLVLGRASSSMLS
ncbi:hypothetical protein P152DRAFT_462666 [Eremomyces bilateralis CBS 781.70]|uniref:Uncharacterized protein n=1 Tax=Eremomyces bilateralis CBS 781.70 TaxID=1392243 RepID=A0A6G1FRN0_9PEZI|nr:uncharacterized protein P152DRAFT_462666 [Eremomyces bilateralis CBS 781.70]KAF1808388.1 hypothetical protein P152DRAFT_462666 [Eremomyces bilateralis CBS 781.70]